jgi:CheY-like chemotaxis protein
MIQAQRMEAIGQLAPGISHELNNRLAAILAMTTLLQTDRSLSPELRRQADGLIDEVRRTNRLVKGLLDLVGTRPADRQPAPLAEIVTRVLDLQTFSFRPGRIEASVKIEDGIPPIPMDRARIEQLLISLTLNAAQAIRTRTERGNVRIVGVRATAGGGDGSAAGEAVVRLSITDDGPGIPVELRPHLFESDLSTRAPGSGSGLGLAASMAIAVDHGGTLRYEPGPDGIGSTFVLELPIGAGPTPHVPTKTDGISRAVAPDGQPPAGSPPGSVPASSSADQATESAPRLPRILILDDEGAIRDFLARVLRRNGFDPVVAADGESALEIVRTDPPAAILCDHRMAGMSGITFYEAVAAIDPRLARRFAFMSGDTNNPELHDFATARDVVVLAKPFDIEGVARTVARLVTTGD